MQTISQNILEITEGVICHQVNCKGVMGAGLAAQIANKYPLILNEYQNACRDNAHANRPSSFLLGRCQLIDVQPGLQVANLFGQDEYGRDRQYTDYDALEFALAELTTFIKEGTPIYIPYKMGCGLGGGRWDIVSAIIEVVVPTAIICKL